MFWAFLFSESLRTIESTTLFFKSKKGEWYLWEDVEDILNSVFDMLTYVADETKKNGNERLTLYILNAHKSIDICALSVYNNGKTGGALLNGTVNFAEVS